MVGTLTTGETHRALKSAPKRSSPIKRICFGEASKQASKQARRYGVFSSSAARRGTERSGAWGCRAASRASTGVGFRRTRAAVSSPKKKGPLFGVKGSIAGYFCKGAEEGPNQQLRPRASCVSEEFLAQSLKTLTGRSI